MYDSVPELLTWQRIARREARDILTRHQIAPDAPLQTVPQPGAELLCPACSSEARPDNQDTATCGSCGTLSPLDTTVSYANFIHHTLHYGVRVRAAMIDGKARQDIPTAAEPFPLIASRVGSLLVLGAVSGLRHSQLEELFASQRQLLGRWYQKEIETGDKRLARAVPQGATAVEIAEGALVHTFGDFPEGFPTKEAGNSHFRKVFHAASQYYKFRSSSVYVAYLVDALLAEVRARHGVEPEAPLAWSQLHPLAKALDPHVVADFQSDRSRGAEEAFSRAVARFIEEKHRLVRSVFSRHRVTVHAVP